MKPNDPVDPLTSVQLDQLMAKARGDSDCAPGDHQIIYLSSACHPMAGLSVCYDASLKVLCIECGQCHAPITVVRVQQVDYSLSDLAMLMLQVTNGKTVFEHLDQDIEKSRAFLLALAAISGAGMPQHVCLTTGGIYVCSCGKTAQTLGEHRLHLKDSLACRAANSMPADLEAIK